MSSEIGAGWQGEVRLAIGRALLAADPKPLTAARLAAATGRDPSNLRKVAGMLAAEGLIEPRAPGASDGRRGRQPKTAYALADGPREELEFALRSQLEEGKLRPSQQIVFVEAGEKMDVLLDVLAEEGSAARGSWAALCDGSRQELMIAFEGSDAVGASLDLMTIFSSVGLQASRGSLSLVDGMTDLIKSAQRRRELRRER
jgi:hypothetical protein